MSAELAVVGVGRMPYAAALELQRSVAARRIAGTVPHDVLLLVEHPPVITLGRGSQPQHLPLSPQALAARGVELFEIERGGDVTFHGPGQLVGYPIFDLGEHRRDLHWFLRALEQALITGLEHLHVAAGRWEGYTGVWTAAAGDGPADRDQARQRKIASIGIHVKQWVTWHGFALNVMTDLSYFDLIVPCGIPDVVMTSVQRELGERAPRDLWARAHDAVILGFAETFGQRPQAVAIEDLIPGPVIHT